MEVRSGGIVASGTARLASGFPVLAVVGLLFGPGRVRVKDDAYHKEMMIRKGQEGLVMIRLRNDKTTGRGWIYEDEGWLINEDEEEEEEEDNEDEEEEEEDNEVEEEEEEEEEETTGGPTIVRGFRFVQSDRPEKLVTVSLCSFKLTYSAERIARDLTDLQVPEEEQPKIIAKVFRLIDKQDVVPLQTIEVNMEDFTAHLKRRHRVVPSRISETKVNYIPATKSSIDGLEKVRLLDLQGLLKKGAAANDTTSLFCVICTEGFFNVDGQGHDHVDDDQSPLLARMPCKHLYHGDCIVQWLERSHLCPLCRYPMPTMPRCPTPTTRNALQMLIDNYTDDMDQD
ncbi:hypothetical protein ACFX12_033490 [Malus domestica]